MKKMLIIIIFIFIGVNAIKAQDDPPDQIVKITNSVFKFGIGLGYRVNLIKLNDPYLLPTDSSLQFQKLPSSAFVISATAVFHLGSTEQPKVLTVKDKKGTLTSYSAYKRKFGKSKAKSLLGSDTSDDILKQESPWSIMVALNIADISSNGASFDKPIDGGIGLGYKIGENINLGFFAEYAGYRQLKDYYIDNFSGKPIFVTGNKLSSLDRNNDTYFYTKPVTSLSLKLIVTLGNNPTGN